MCDLPPARPLPPPRLILRLGGLGNRQFGREGATGLEDDPKRLREAAERACAAVLAAVEQALLAIHQADATATFPPMEHERRYRALSQLGWLFGQADPWQRVARAGQPASVFAHGGPGDRPLVTLLTGGEEGGDALIRDTGLARSAGGRVEFEHREVKPAAPAAVADGGLGIGSIPDPRSAPKDRLPDRAEAHTLAETARQRAFGFRGQSEALRHHADVLLAIWDPDREGKAGGTSESVLLALQERIPVIAIRLTAAQEASIQVLQRPEDLRAAPALVSTKAEAEAQAAVWQPALQGVLDRALRFPDPPPRKAEPGAETDCLAWLAAVFRPHGRHETSHWPRATFATFREGAPVTVPWPAQIWRGFEDFTTTDEKKEIGVVTLLGRWLSAPLELWLRMPAPGKKADAPPKDVVPGGFGAHFGAAKSRASELSGAFGDAHRGGIITSYLLAALAVLLALAGSALSHAHAPAVCLAAVALAEVFAIGGMWALSKVSQLEDWHEAYTDCRILAEALRMMEHLGPLGIHTPLPKLPVHLTGTGRHPGEGGQSGPDEPMQPQDLWCVWYFRALIRQAPLRSAGAPVAAPPQRTDHWGKSLKGWIDGQIAYHSKKAATQKRLHHGVEWLIAVVFFCVTAAAVIHFAVVSCGLLSGGHGEQGGAVLHTLCFFLSVGGPAVISALHGLLSQIDTERLRQRSESMVRLLAARRGTLASLDLGNDSAGAVWGLSTEALATAGLMMDETADWSLIYRNADIQKH